MLFLSCIYVYFCLAFQENPYLIIFYNFLFYSASALALANASAAALNAFPLMAGTSSAIIGMVQIGSGLLGSSLASVLPTSPLILGTVLGALSLLSVLAGILVRGKEPNL
ncbi:hypothetical protein [Candidatus Paracaedibacter symbiosus]|uniref:hypothetical protein n=1 Tax=Candidatus Paracaedibacter symbiosus TaxID=244582 RepID=UPI000509E6EF|nr:hypothetical protein [Candidatus Paracaedibacter symbiosus]